VRWGSCHINVTINLPAKDERHWADKGRLTRGESNKSRCQLMTGGRGNVRRLLTMGDRDNKSWRLQ
jgi:hypothetical protein